MPHNFQNFLDLDESLLCVSKRKKDLRSFYFIFFLILPIIFFFLYPLMSYGRYGLSLWLSLLFLSIYIFIIKFNHNDDLYLLTNKRLLFLHKKALDYQLKGSVNLTKITKLKKIGKNNLSLWLAHKRFDLLHLENRDSIYQKIVQLKLK